ncbi:MFS general substrate transporter [Coniella lustricola]|uniref:MFS general substrate transporter n=1 Tax=Coniella lustricola TaxID=2025994 RepID=A0A2T3A1R9_9PEZI|nr:MFS general substrate transporter [Coniella lustricola]
MAVQQDVVITEESAHGVDAAMAKRVLRKIDMRLIPLLFVTYALNFMDKTILSSASVFGLQDDTNLQGQDYSWVSSIFYFGYLAWTYPTNILIARLPVARYMTVNALIWGLVVGLTAACTNYGGLLTVRFLLGAAEATITPAFMFITTSWYTRDEIPVRTGIWFAGNSIGGMIASLFAFGVGHIDSSGHNSTAIVAWRWMYIILGIATVLWAVVLFLVLPNSISTARFLTPLERQYAADRIIVAGTGRTEATTWNWAQARECLVDPKTWFIVALELLTQMPNGGTQNFANLVIESFGFTSLQSTLVNIPYSLLSGASIFLTGWLAGHFRQANCLLIIAVVIPPVVGSALLYARDSGNVPKGVQLFGYFLMCTGPSAMPLAMSLVQANYRGVTKKLTVTAMLFITYCVGNMAGPQFFRTTEAPTYQTAFRAIMVCYALAILSAVGLRVYLGCVNARRATEEGFEGSAGASGAVAGGKVVDLAGSRRDAAAAAAAAASAIADVQLRDEDFEDVTDWQISGFRYRL